MKGSDKFILVDPSDTKESVRAKRIAKSYGVNSLPNTPSKLNAESHAERTLLNTGLPLRNDPEMSDEYRDILKARIQRARNIEDKIESMGFEKIPVDSSYQRAKLSKRPFSFKKGDRILKALGPAAFLTSLFTSDDAAAALDPFGSEEVAIDPAIEDPSSPEYAERMRRLRVQQLMQGNK